MNSKREREPGTLFQYFPVVARKTKAIKIQNPNKELTEITGQIKKHVKKQLETICSFRQNTSKEPKMSHFNEYLAVIDRLQDHRNQVNTLASRLDEIFKIDETTATNKTARKIIDRFTNVARRLPKLFERGIQSGYQIVELKKLITLIQEFETIRYRFNQNNYDAAELQTSIQNATSRIIASQQKCLGIQEIKNCVLKKCQSDSLKLELIKQGNVSFEDEELGLELIDYYDITLHGPNFIENQLLKEHTLFSCLVENSRLENCVLTDCVVTNCELINCKIERTVQKDTFSALMICCFDFMLLEMEDIENTAKIAYHLATNKENTSNNFRPI